MRTTRTISVSLPPDRLQDMERTAKKENRTMSELVREIYKRYVSDEARQEFSRTLEALRAEAAKTPASKLTIRQLSVCADPDDDRFLECALAARAAYLITGNPRHFPKRYEAVAIMTPRERLSQLILDLG